MKEKNLQFRWLYPARISSKYAAAKSLQLCPTLCDPIDGIPPGPAGPWDSRGKNAGVGCHFLLQCMKVKSEREVTQSCLTLSDPMDCSLPGFSIHAVFQARILEWGAIAFSNNNLGSRLFPFITLSMSFHSLLAWRVSIERSAVILMGIPLCVISCFSLSAFNICSLCLIFVNLINMCLGVFCLGLILFGTLWVSSTWVAISFPTLGKFSTIISSSIFSWSSFCLLLWDPMIRMLGLLTLSQR